jgi:hypothetical protein
MTAHECHPIAEIADRASVERALALIAAMGWPDLVPSPPASPRHDVPCRAPAAVRILREDAGWLVVAGAHGWLHGDEPGALADARWLAGNFGLPIRRRGKREGDA